MALSFEILESIKTVIVHENCSDGLASAIILREALPAAKFIFVQYETELHKTLPAEPGMMFCDFSPHPSRVADFVAAKAFVLDHHKTAKPIVAAFGDRGIFADETMEKGTSGASLAYREVWLPTYGTTLGHHDFVETFALLVGVRDTWHKTSPLWDESVALHATMTSLPVSWWMGMPLREIALLFRTRFGNLGYHFLDKYAKTVSDVAKKSFRETSAKGTRIAIIESLVLTSDVAEKLDDAVDLLVGFGYVHDPLKLVCSLRSHTDFDCSMFAKSHGGGGHTKAAGFSIPITSTDPYSEILRLVDVFEKYS